MCVYECRVWHCTSNGRWTHAINYRGLPNLCKRVSVLCTDGAEVITHQKRHSQCYFVAIFNWNNWIRCEEFKVWQLSLLHVPQNAKKWLIAQYTDSAPVYRDVCMPTSKTKPVEQNRTMRYADKWLVADQRSERYNYGPTFSGWTEKMAERLDLGWKSSSEVL